MKQTKAKKDFKKRFGQANHFLITALVGLDAIGTDKIIAKPHSFSTSWSPQNISQSVLRTRDFILKSFLGWAVESLEMYLTELNRKPKALDSDKFSDIYSEAGRSIYKKAINIGDEMKIDPILIGLVEILITWRNHTFHYDIDNKIRSCSHKILDDNKDKIQEQFCGLDVSLLLENWKNKKDFTFKEVASLISATHKYVENVDQYIIRQLNVENYLFEHLKEKFDQSKLAIQKLNSFPHEKKLRYLKTSIQNSIGIEIDDDKILESLCGRLSS